MTHIVYAYGTLRPGKVADVVRISGTMFDIGRFPGVRRELRFLNRVVTCEKIVVTDDELAELDNYEGYFPDRLEESLYLREPFRDGWIYLFNRDTSAYPIIACGDWMLHNAKKENP